MFACFQNSSMSLETERVLIFDPMEGKTRVIFDQTNIKVGGEISHLNSALALCCKFQLSFADNEQNWIPTIREVHKLCPTSEEGCRNTSLTTVFSDQSRILRGTDMSETLFLN